MTLLWLQKLTGYNFDFSTQFQIVANTYPTTYPHAAVTTTRIAAFVRSKLASEYETLTKCNDNSKSTRGLAYPNATNKDHTMCPSPAKAPSATPTL